MASESDWREGTAGRVDSGLVTPSLLMAWTNAAPKCNRALGKEELLLSLMINGFKIHIGITGAWLNLQQLYCFLESSVVPAHSRLRGHAGRDIADSKEKHNCTYKWNVNPRTI